MAVATATVIGVGISGYNAYSGYKSAQQAKENLSDQEYERYLAAQSIDDQIVAEASLRDEELGLLEAENAIAGDKLDLSNEKAISDLGYKGEGLELAGEKSEEGLKSGLEKTLMSGATSFRQSGEAQRAATAASGFAGSGTGQQSQQRDAMNQMMFAQQQQTTKFGQEQSMLDMQGRQLDDAYGFQERSYDLEGEALAQQYERDQFGADKDYQRAVGALEARQQELAPGY